MGILKRLGQVIKSVFGIETIEEKIGKKAILSAEMKEALKIWSNLYKNSPDWDGENIRKLNLAPGIASEFARLVTLEFKSLVSGSEYADYINTIYQKFLKTKLRTSVEKACAKGGIMLKPYWGDGKILIDVVDAENFYPLEQNSNGDITGAAFVTTKTVGDRYYTKIETHNYKNGIEHIENTAYMSTTRGIIGQNVSLKAVPEWAKIAPVGDITDLKNPLFIYVKMPLVNKIDESSPFGTSVYSEAIDLLEDADVQYSRYLWEYEGGELAVFANRESVELVDSETGEEMQMPKRFRRLILKGDGDPTNGDGYHEYAPALRDGSYGNGLNAILRRIEFNCSLAYGTLSDIQSVDKTAEEIRTSKQRSFSAVSDIQKALEDPLEHLIYAIGVWCAIAKVASPGDVQASFDWADSVLTDRDKEFEQKIKMFDRQILKSWEVRSWYNGEDEKTAKKMTEPDIDELEDVE